VTTSGPEPTAGRVPLERIMGKPMSVHVPAEADAPGVAAAVAAAFDEFVSGHKVHLFTIAKLRRRQEAQRKPWADLDGAAGVACQPVRHHRFGRTIPRHRIAPFVAGQQFWQQFCAQTPAIARGPVDV
jgi:hypothetical protein